VDEQKANGRRGYQEKLDEYHCTTLRQEFKKQLTRFAPTLSPSAWPDHPSFLREMKDHLNDLEPEDCPDWVRRCINNEELEDGTEDKEVGGRNEDEEVGG